QGSDPETTRLIVLAAAALERRGVAPSSTRRHLMLAQKGGLGTLLAKRTPFSHDEIMRAEQAAQRGGFTMVLTPDGTNGGTLARLVDAGAWSGDVRAFPQNIVPPTDDQPVFFYFVKPAQLWDVEQHFGH